MGTPIVRPPAIRDREDQYQRDAREAIKQLDAPGARKITVSGVLLGTTTVLVNHQLGKKPVGWLVVSKNAQADIWSDSTQPTTSDKIPLKASATVTVDLQFW